MQTVRDLLKNKSTDIINVSPAATVFEALQIMSDKDIGAVLVMLGDELQGIFSERDYARKVILLGKSSRELLVHEVMTQKVFTIDGNHSIEQCMQLMTEKRIRHLPVYENGKLVGVVSIGDVVKAVIAGKEHLINQLEQYITGVGFSS